MVGGLSVEVVEQGRTPRRIHQGWNGMMLVRREIVLTLDRSERKQSVCVYGLTDDMSV